jgi:microcystin-dependent protein
MRLNTFLLSMLLFTGLCTSAHAQQNIPVGTVISYAGEIVDVPAGFLVCDGREYSESDYPKLYKAIQRAWGGDANGHTFRVPDLRGLFLRGVNDSKGGAFIDPEATQRVSQNGGNVGNKVGSVQTDTIQKHAHTFTAAHGVVAAKVFQGTGGTEFGESGRSTDLFGGAETRPKNAYVYYLIASK